MVINMLPRKPYLLIGLSAVFGLGAAVFASGWIEKRVSVAEHDLRNGKPVVVAATAIPFGAKIQADQIKILNWPADNIPEGAYTRADEVVGKFTNQKLMSGEVVLHERAVEFGGGSSLSMQIAPTRRAITVRVNDVIGVGGFLLPGNRVDVLATRMTEERRAQTRTLLQNLKVLAVDQSAQADKDKPVVVRAVTLEVDPPEAELLVAATEEGTVQLALRNPEDSIVAPVVAVASAALPPVARRTPRLHPAEIGPSVMVIRQTQVMTAEVKP